MIILNVNVDHSIVIVGKLWWDWFTTGVSECWRNTIYKMKIKLWVMFWNVFSLVCDVQRAVLAKKETRFDIFKGAWAEKVLATKVRNSEEEEE